MVQKKRGRREKREERREKREESGVDLPDLIIAGAFVSRRRRLVPVR